ncbi:MAG: Hydroxyacylglutathione hydrolase GloC [Ignavibacteria bacterium]|nr:Hydroxyacylglutathione hydrolase GloC [Ignavibacteria bacterium]
MEIKQFVLNPFSMNCYIYFDENSKEGIIIDPAADSEKEKEQILEFIKKNNIKIKFIVNTHGHIDHILGNKFAKDSFKVPILMNGKDEFLISAAKEQSRFFGLNFPEPPPIDTYIQNNTKITINGTELIFLNTPGHSPGSVCMIDHQNKIAFCGDLIFKNSVGRTDLQGGDFVTLLDSIKNKLFQICGDDYALYPGHMEKTNVKDEKELNPFLK